MWRVSLAIIGAAGTILACNGGSGFPPPDQGLAAKIVIISGDAQTAAAGTELPDSLVVRVTDSKDQPVRGQRVGFGASVGTVAPAATATNADGRTGAIWVLGPAAGPQTVTATATGNGTPPGLAVTFHATATSSAPAKLEKVAGDGQQATAGSPVATPPAIKVTDAGGNPVAGAAVSFAVSAGGGSVIPTTPASTDATGVAAVTAWTLGPVAGSNTLTATIPGTGITGNPATFTATGVTGTAGKLAITQQPSATAQSGVPFAQQPRLQVQDAQGNPVKAGGLAVKVTLASGAGGQLTGQLTVPTDANGIAAFTNLALAGPQGGYTLAFSNPTLAGVTSAAIVLGAGAAAQLVIAQQPAAAAQGGVPLNPQPVVQVKDAQGNPVPQAGIAVTASLNGSGGSLSGAKTVTTDGTGSAAFTNLAIGASSGAYTITFSAPPLVSATSITIALSAGTSAKLAFTQQPASVTAGKVLRPTAQVSIEDGSGNVVTGATNPVTVAIGNNPGGSKLSGTLTVSPVGGVASFSNLSLDKAGNGYTLVATSGSLTQATSASFNVAASTPVKLEKTAGAGQTATVGTAVATPPAVKVTDAGGNPVAWVPVTFAVAAGGGSVNPTTVNTSATGIAAVTSWTLGAVAGTNTLTATIPGSGIAGNPATFTATGTVGNATKLTIIRQPSATAQSGVPLTQQPQVQVQDALGNPVKTAGLAVTASIASGAGVALSGKLTVATDAQGLASFTNLTLTGLQGSYTLAFSNPTLAGTTSAAIVLGAGVAAQLGVVQQPASVARSGVLLNPQPVVQIKDAQGNPVAQAGTAVTATLNGAGGSLGGTKTVTTDATGKAAFTNLVISGSAGAYSITFSASLLMPATSNAIAIGAGVALYSINFDDGYESSYLNGLPVVEAAGYKTTQFIITGLLGHPGYVTQDQVLQMYRNGHEIGAHTRTHPHLSSLSATDQQTEIQGSYNDLCVILGRCPEDFAYPYGDFNATTVSIVKSVGFASARTTVNGYNGANADKFQLRAFLLSSTTQFSEVQTFIEGAYDQKVWAIILFHRVDEADPYSVPHQLLQQILDYLKQKNATVVTQSEALHLMGL